VEVVENVGKWWKTGQGLEGVQEGWKSCRRFGKGPEGRGKVWKRWEGTGSNSTLHAATKYVGSHSQLAVFPKKGKFSQFGSPVLGLSISGKIMRLDGINSKKNAKYIFRAGSWS